MFTQVKKSGVSLIMSLCLVLSIFQGTIVSVKAADTNNVIVWCPDTNSTLKGFIDYIKDYFSQMPGVTVNLKQNGELTESEVENASLIYIFDCVEGKNTQVGMSIINSKDLIEKYTKRGGRVILNGERGPWAKEGNETLKTLANSLGCSFSIVETDRRGRDSFTFNKDYDPGLTDGLDSGFKTSAFAEIKSTSPNAVWIAKNSSGEVAIMEEPVNKGMITFINDINYLNNNATQAKRFLSNALNTSIESIENAKIRNISFDMQEGNNGLESASSKIGETLPDITVPVRPGYTFEGYFTEADGKGVKYYDSEGKAVKINDFEDDVTLFADWKAIPASAPAVVDPADVDGLIYGNIDSSVNVKATAATDAEYVLSYQWYSSTDKSNSNGTAIRGAVSDTYSLPQDLKVGDYHYYCIVTATRKDNYEAVTAVSNANTVTVNKKAATVSAEDQIIELGSEISKETEKATLTDAVVGDVVISVTLTPSDISKPTRKASITPSDVVIADSNGNIVTDNYDITYVSSNLTVKGEKTIDISVNTEESSIVSVQNFNSELVLSLLDEEEMADYEAGVPVKMYMEIKYIEDKDVSDEEKEVLDGVIAENNFQIGQYIDITLWKKVGDNEPVQVKNVEDKILITLALPDTVNNYSLIRIHENEAEILASATATEIAFETNLFSTYVLAYTTPEPEKKIVANPVEKVKTKGDKPVKKVDSPKKSEFVAKKVSSEKNELVRETISPKTGYENRALIYYVLMLLSLISIAYISVDSLTNGKAKKSE